MFVYQLCDFKYLTSLGLTGQGPEDMLFPFFMQSDTEASGEQTLYDVNLARIKTLTVDSLLTGTKATVKKDIPLPAKVLGSTDMAQADEKYIGTTDMGEGLFFIYSIVDDALTWIPYSSSLADMSNEDLRMQVSQDRITVQVEKGLVAVAMRYYNQLFLYDTNGKPLKGGSFGKEIEPVFEGNNMSTSSRLFFSQLSSTKDYIYVVAANQTHRDRRPSSQRLSDLFIFDWNLNHVKTLKTNKRIQRILIDPVYGRLLAICIDDEEELEFCYAHFKENELSIR